MLIQIFSPIWDHSFVSFPPVFPGQVYILHDKMKDLNKLDQEKLDEMKQNYDPKSEKIFESTWDLSDSNKDDTIINNLYEDISNLKIQENQDSDNSDSFSW